MIRAALARLICEIIGHDDRLIWPWFHCQRCLSSVRVPK